MKYGQHWAISNEKKEEYINKLLPQLASLRAKAELSQDELSNLVGISRQTYCLTESGARGMSWNTYLSIIMFFDYNTKTHDLIRRTGVFPEDLFYQFNPGEENPNDGKSFDKMPELDSMFAAIDKDGRAAIRAVLVAEFARCTKIDKSKMLSLMGDIL